MKVKEIIDVVESFAPTGIQESWDNSGLIVGEAECEVSGLLLCLDITEAVLDEAKEMGCNMILSHHPMVFTSFRKFSGNDPVSRLIRRAIKEDFIIYSAHTNLDQVPDGVSGAIAERIGLLETSILVPRKDDLLKLVCFIPEEHYEVVSAAVFEAGAGHIGNYDSCGFCTTGTGSFRALEEASPFVGQLDEVHQEPEKRFETIFPKHLRRNIISALIEVHPYDEVAYDLYPLVNDNPAYGLGVLGHLPKALSEIDFLQNIKNHFGAKCIRHTALLGKEVKRVAVCGGSGSEYLNHAIKAGADVYITADVKYHQFFDTDGKILLLDIGHYESEQVVFSIFNNLFLKKMTNFAIHLSKISTNPINYF